MKHLVYIHIIIIGFSALCAYFLFYEKKENTNPYIIVNKKTISEKDYKKAIINKPYYLDDKEFTDQLIEKEVLLQEAMKKNLHQNEEFSQKIKSFYEKNLVQLLMEKKFDEFSKIDISQDLIDLYLKCNKMRVMICDSGEKDIQKVMDFKFAPNSVKYKFIFNSEEKVSVQDQNLSEIVYCLTDLEAEKNEKLTRENAVEDLKFIRSRYLWKEWIDALKNNSEIIISESLKGIF